MAEAEGKGEEKVAGVGGEIKLGGGGGEPLAGKEEEDKNKETD